MLRIYNENKAVSSARTPDGINQKELDRCLAPTYDYTISSCCGARFHEYFIPGNKNTIPIGIRLFSKWKEEDIPANDSRTEYKKIKFGENAEILVQFRISGDAGFQGAALFLAKDHLPLSPISTKFQLPEKDDVILNFVYFAQYSCNDRDSYRASLGEMEFNRVYPVGSAVYTHMFDRDKTIIHKINTHPDEYYMFIISIDQEKAFDIFLKKGGFESCLFPFDNRTFINANMSMTTPRLKMFIINKGLK
jgi:hypothetical protein